jgi:hypothetical protein
MDLFQMMACAINRTANGINDHRQSKKIIEAASKG